MRYPGGVISATPPTVNQDEASGLWTLSQQMQYQGQGLWPSSQYQISRSLRFNSADSAYLSRTPASAGNRRTWTWSGWVKRSYPDGVLNSQNINLFSAQSGTPWFQLGFEYYGSNVGQLDISFTAGVSAGTATNAIFRDFSAWYHIVLAVDTTQATAADRLKLYVNGVEQTFGRTNYPAQNFDTQVNSTIPHYIGRANSGSYLNGYLTEVHFVDGQALTADDFGETDATTGVWKPKEYTGTYGTNGFYLNFSDNSGVTAATLGADSSGNGNNWTPNNFSVTAGVDNDSLVDTPTPYGTDTGVGGEVRGNYCTWNPLALDSAVTLSNGNLNISATYRGNQAANFLLTSGKWYWEGSIISGDGYIGSIVDSSYTLNADVSVSSAGSKAVGYWSGSGVLFDENGTNQTGGATYTTGDIIGVALDMDSGNVKFYKNNVLQYTYTFGSGSNLTFANGAFPNYNQGQTSGTRTAEYNFGQRPFAYTAPSGFKALCTQNLPTPTVVQGDDYFNTVLYTGNGSTQSITGVGFQPDFIWFKRRDAVAAPALNDAVRGATKSLTSYSTEIEYTSATGDDLVSFDSDGFSVGPTDIWSSYNVSGGSIVAWNWNAGGSNATNTDGTITSTVRANPTAGFSIVSWTADGSASNSIGHGLGTTPVFVINKNRDAASNWWVWTTIIDGSNDDLRLNLTNAKADITGYGNLTSTTISNYGFPNGDRIIAYCFAEVEGYSKFGSYTGNGSTDGAFVYCGFRPAYILLKSSSATGSWCIYDTKTGAYNVVGDILLANSNAATNTGNNLDILSNGFKLRNTNISQNTNGTTYIFAAFAENPFKYSLAR